MQSSNDQIPQNFGQIGSISLNQNIMLLQPPTPLSVRETDTLHNAIVLLQDYHIGCAIVVDAVGKLKGIFSERDIVIKWALSDVPAEEVPIADIMTADPNFLTNDSTIAAALYTMSKGGFRHLPITDEAGLPVGIVSVKDVMDYISMQFMKNLFS